MTEEQERVPEQVGDWDLARAGAVGERVPERVGGWDLAGAVAEGERVPEQVGDWERGEIAAALNAV